MRDLADTSIVELQNRVLRAVMMSMTFTGAYKTIDGKDFYSHNDYDDAMAALFELTRRAKGGAS